MGHRFEPAHSGWEFCRICKKTDTHPNHILTFSGMETADADRTAALGLAQAEEMTAELRKPLGDVSGKAGRMEREAPLFFGQGDNPTLF